MHEESCDYYKAAMQPHEPCDHGFGACPWCDSCTCEWPEWVDE